MAETGLFFIAACHSLENKMTNPVFSIIIPTYKRPLLLARAVRSVINQTFRDFECIVVDDAGDTGVAQIVRQFDDRRIVLIQHTSNKGTSAAYNTGIKASRGSLISILDDDDEYFPTLLEKTHLFFQNAPSRIGFVWTGVLGVEDAPDGETLRYERVWPADIQPKDAAYVAATTIGNGFGLTMRRGCVDAVGLYNESFRVCDDTEYLFRLAKRFDFATIPEILVKIHHHENGQLTHRDNDELRLELHERILTENADFVAPYPGLYDVHYRRVAEMSYSLNMRKKGRQILLKLAKNRPMRPSLLIDFVCYECSGVDAATVWGQSRIRKLLSRVKRSFYQRRNLWEIRKFDAYRTEYDTMSFRTLAKRTDSLRRQCPERAHFSLPPVVYWFDNVVARPAAVLEIGGRRGDLAMKMLSKYEFISCWHNYDIMTDKNAQKCSDPRYTHIIPEDYIWNLPVDRSCNALVATRVIEHMKWRELLLLIGWIPEHITSVLLEAPIKKSVENYDWTGDRSTRILEKGWEQVIREMQKTGFEAIYSKGDTVVFVRSHQNSQVDAPIETKGPR
jgi:glycosyltransferase involved in cell wall biosynthesis